MGFLHSTPEGAKENRLSGVDVDMCMPEIESFEYLLPWWLDVGPCEGDRPISYQELCNFHTDLTLFEKETIRTMSKRYLIGLNKGHDKKAQPPYEWRTSKEAQRALSDKINRIFS